MLHTTSRQKMNNNLRVVVVSRWCQLAISRASFRVVKRKKQVESSVERKNSLLCTGHMRSYIKMLLFLESTYVSPVLPTVAMMSGHRLHKHFYYFRPTRTVDSSSIALYGSRTILMSSLHIGRDSFCSIFFSSDIIKQFH